MSGRAEAVIGVPMYGPGEHARKALELLLAQTFEPVALVVVDDGGGGRDHIADLLSDHRVHYLRNECRLGLVANWRRTFEHGRELHPRARYFAWASDHDVWHPRWLERLVEELADDPEAVLVYPYFGVIDGCRSRPREGGFETRDVHDPVRRVALSYPRIKPGYMVYGLYRAAALERCGVFRAVLAPDRLLLAELSVLGTFLEVPERLWHRRLTEKFSIARQRRAFFPDRAPVSAFLPWWLVHVAVFWWAVSIRSDATTPREGLRLALVHASVCLEWVYVRRRRAITRAYVRRRQATTRAVAQLLPAGLAVAARRTAAGLCRADRRHPIDPPATEEEP